MKYTKYIIISQIQFKYNITKKQAENMYREFERTDDTDVLASVVFKPDFAAADIAAKQVIAAALLIIWILMLNFSLKIN